MRLVGTAVAALLILEASPASAASVSWSSCSDWGCDYAAVANHGAGGSTATVTDGSADGQGAALVVEYFNGGTDWISTTGGQGSSVSSNFLATIRRARICDYLDVGGLHNCGDWKYF